jgi:hypothetical protein
VLPAWLVAADAAVLLLGVGAVFVALSGRAQFFGTRLVVLPSSLLLLFLAAAILAVRHTARPRPGIASTLRAWRGRLEAHPHWAAAVRAFVATRPLVFAVAYFAVVTIGFPKSPGFTASSDPLANLPARFDAGWYGDIALDGYEWSRQYGRQQNTAFFPALPMLMRPAGAAIGMNVTSLPRDKRMVRALWGGVLVSLVAFLFALYYVSRLGDLLAGPHAARAAPLVLAAYPFAVFFSAPYTESLFLLGAAGAFLHFHRAQWVRAALFGLLVGFSRPNGCLLSIPLAVLAVTPPLPDAAGGASFRARLRSLGVRLAVAAMPGIAMLIFTAYLYRLTGVWLVWARMHEAWGRKWGTGPIQQGWEWLTTEGLLTVLQGVPFDALNTLAAVFAVSLLWPTLRRLGPAHALFVIVNLVPPVFAGGALSLGRVTSTLFPIFIALASMLRPVAVPSWVAAFAIGQGLVAALFFTWRELF